jgi:hypothetical protein
MAFIKTMSGKHQTKGLTTRAARIRRLKERLAVERDERVREMIEAQLRAFSRTGRS